MFEKIAALFRRGDSGEPSEFDFYVSNPETHNTVYKKGTALVSPHIWLNGRMPKLTNQASSDLQLGIRYLRAVTTYNPSNWNAHWIIGKAYQALRRHQDSYQSFKNAYAIEKNNPNVAREYADACLQLGYGAEAVTLAIAAIQAAPQDAGLRANLALAHLIAGDIALAKRAIEESLQMNPADEISKRVQRVICDVADGKRIQPRTMSDLK
jgi:tetratricopeptide (TPR) repeat protein